MLQLRLTQHDSGPGRHRVEIEVGGDGPRRTASSTFAFTLAREDEEDLRWYFEESLLYPHEPARIVARIERRIAELGEELFAKIFDANADARARWAEVRGSLSAVRIEIVTSLDGASAIPWELMRDPHSATVLALAARSFVRAHPAPVLPPRPAAEKLGRVRILLVLCRPGGARDIAFRSIASRLLRGLSETNRAAFELEVLRPPTFERLSEVLTRAWNGGDPYHVVHFDGHGGYLDLEAFVRASEGRPTTEAERAALEELDFDPLRFSPQLLYPHEIRPGLHSYLVFENPRSEQNQRLVDGPELARLLVATGVSTLVLNACRSAYARRTQELERGAARSTEASFGNDPARAWATLAQEVMDAGVPAIVAMRYNLWVATAAQFVADLYGALARGETVGEAVGLGRKQLSSNPLREIAFDPMPLQDWPVPIVYEAAPLALFHKSPACLEEPLLRVRKGPSALAGADREGDLPPPPDAGFFGRDETLLALDRAFDRDQLVLLHGWAGGGKTAAAAEFARWYEGTGGVRGCVLFSSFARHLPLSRLLDRIGREFGEELEQNDVRWSALDDARRRELALLILQQIPVLWIWDGVEQVNGFPEGSASAWSTEEQAEILSFLRALRETRAKVLLTSRRDERTWLGELPTRVHLPPMIEAESLQLMRVLAAKHGRRLTSIEDWRPLLAFAQGHPMALTILAGEAL
ncbi:MAG TPA: CHAT domain-containing protein, partial [Thermoanaerobaculia bacterium]